MASKQRTRAPKKGRSSSQPHDLGIFNIPDLDIMDDDNESDVDESTLESELEAILSGKTVSKPRQKKKAPVPMDIETMAAECMKDIDDDDEDDDALLTDPDLLKELRSLSFETTEEENVTPSVEKDTPIEMNESAVPTNNSNKMSTGGIVSLLEERLKLYQNAMASAKELNDNSKVRRYGRAVKTLEEQIKSAKSGRNVNEEDIPPVVSISKAKPRPPLKPDIHCC